VYDASRSASNEAWHNKTGSCNPSSPISWATRMVPTVRSLPYLPLPSPYPFEEPTESPFAPLGMRCFDPLCEWDSDFTFVFFFVARAFDWFQRVSKTGLAILVFLYPPNPLFILNHFVEHICWRRYFCCWICECSCENLSLPSPHDNFFLAFVRFRYRFCDSFLVLVLSRCLFDWPTYVRLGPGWTTTNPGRRPFLDIWTLPGHLPLTHPPFSTSSGRSQSSQDDAPKYTPQQISQMISQQQQQAASNPYTVTGSGGPLTPTTNNMFSPGLSASLPTRDVSMRDATTTSSSASNNNTSTTPNNSSNSNSQSGGGGGGGVQLPSLSGLGLGGLGNVGMSLGGGGGSPMGYVGSMGMGVPMGSVNPYARR
jgi:hypothetical protein